MTRGIRLGLVGASFARYYLPALTHHPAVTSLSICDPDAAILTQVGQEFGIPANLRHTDLAALLAAGDCDGVMILSPIPLHAEQTLHVLEAGLHCACTVPMATTAQECERIRQAQARSKSCYFLLETACFTPEFLYLRDLARSGEMGTLQFLRGVWFHHLDQHPAWWHGLPPMHYISHSLGPLLMLAGRKVRRVQAMGSGTQPAGFTAPYGNPFPIESALFELGDDPLSERVGPVASTSGPLAIEITSITAHTAIEARESFDIFGSRQTFLWSHQRGDRHTLIRRTVEEPRFHDKSNPTVISRLEHMTVGQDLPRELSSHSCSQITKAMIHEFVTACLAERPAAISIEEAIAITLPGLDAHHRAMSATETRS